MIQLTNLSKSFGGDTLLRDINLKVLPRQKIGFVGRNGSGKSTLFKIILGEEYYDDGELSIPKNYRIGALKQHLQFSEATLKEECALALPEGEEWNFYKIEKLLFGLGFSHEDLDKDPLSFSGGYQIRINLVKLLATEPNMLLLDEPTNYLDIVSLRWLRSFIKSFDGEVILITHDREFMDSISTHTMGINRKGLHLIEGNSHKFYETLALADETYEKTKANQEKKRKELEDFIARNKARASTAAMAQSKVKELEKMEDLGDLQSEASLEFDFSYAPTPAKIVLRANNLSFGYDDKPNLFENVSFDMQKGKTIAIIGKNGKGKSTLLNLIAGEFESREGNIDFHPSTTFAHFGQTNIERLNTKVSILDEIATARRDIGIAEVRSIAGRMMFSGDSAKKKIELLSGGERSRVMLGKIIATPANLLFLDEPTNHLDMQSIDALCDAIEGFEGSTMLVTHSEMLLHRLANALIIFHHDKAEYFDGTYSEFLEKIGWEEEESEKPNKAKAQTKTPSKPKKKTKLSYKEQKAYESLPNEIEELESKIEELNNCLGNPDCYQEKGLSELSQELVKVEELYEVKSDEYLELLELVEEIEG
ncbi:MAG: ABC-F family ATP-binding cassette domain-containing protein [Campylobacterota bacterium]|nr:ABC-F family ATP-binding cassette domain-containing protein [Campylobacterota bacterium]